MNKHFETIMAFFKRNYPFILVWIGPLVIFGSLLVSGKVVFWGTSYLQFLPWRLAGWESIMNGYLPAWNYYNGYGAPLLANYQSAFLYPPNGLIWVLALINNLTGIAKAQTILIIIHLGITGCGMVVLTRSLGYRKIGQTLAALSFSLSGYLISRASFLSMNAVITWLPWILFVFYRLAVIKGFKAGITSKYFISAVFFTSLLLLAGHAQLAWYTIVLGFFWILTWAWVSHKWSNLTGLLAIFFIVIILAIGISSVQLLPTAEYLSLSQRSSNVEYSYALNYSFWPWRFLTLLSPNLFGNPANGNYWVTADNFWEDNIHVGIIALVFAFATIIRLFYGRYNQNRIKITLTLFLIGAIIVSVILALGRYTPVFPFLYKHIPTFDMFQAPTRFSIWLVLSISLLGGIGIDDWQKPVGRSLYWSRLLTAGAIGITVTSWLIGKINNRVFEDTYIIGIGETGFFLALFMINYLFGTKNGNGQTGSKGLPRALMIVVITGELLYANWGINPGLRLTDLISNKQVEETEIPLDSQSLIYITNQSEQNLKFEKFFRSDSFHPENSWSDLREFFIPNSNIIDGYASVNNFDPLITERYDLFIKIIAPYLESQSDDLNTFWGIQYVINDDKPANNVVTVEQDEYYRIRWFPCIQPTENIAGALESFNHILSSGEYKNILVLEGTNLAETNCDVEPSIIKINGYTSSQESSKFDVETSTDGWLMQLGANYPGWKARLDGQQVKVHYGDVMFRAIYLPAGKHEVEFYYKSEIIFWGFFISLSSILITFIIAITGNRKLRGSAENNLTKKEIISVSDAET